MKPEKLTFKDGLQFMQLLQTGCEYGTLNQLNYVYLLAAVYFYDCTAFLTYNGRGAYTDLYW